MSLLSVIVTTYNWPTALQLCLAALFVQNDTNFEIIVADDGSSLDNLALNKTLCSAFQRPIQYVYHEDNGFRAGTIRNKAVARSSGSYLIFLDGDCIVRPDFVGNHRQLATKGYFVPGNRILLSKEFTQEVQQKNILLHTKSLPYFLTLRLKGNINKIVPFIKLPLGILRLLQPQKWQKAMTCNLAVWRDDFIYVNGFDEMFEGWGYEDSDLVIRLIHAGIRRKEGRFAVPVLHLWHMQSDRGRQIENYERLLSHIAKPDFIFAKKGVSQYL